jgi:FHA domain
MTAPDQRESIPDAPAVPPLRAAGGLSSLRLLEIAASRGAAGDCLCLEDGPAGDVVVVSLVAERTRIGRGIAANLQLDDPTVSRRHALIVRDAWGATVLDERSLNGVLVNGCRVSSRRLEHGDEIRLGRRRLLYARLTGAAARVESPPDGLCAA